MQILVPQISVSRVQKDVLSVETMQRIWANAPTYSQLMEVGGDMEGDR